ncbi:MAG: alkaline phosphatase [Nocardioides sp.]
MVFVVDRTPSVESPFANPDQRETPPSSSSASPDKRLKPTKAAVVEVSSPITHVIALSIDGLSPAALTQLGNEALPGFTRMRAEGASTLNARSDYDYTVTLPNHTSMLTGRPVRIERGGHGVTINTQTDKAVADYAGEPVASVFDVVHDAGGSTALFASKEKFSIFRTSWPDSIDRYAMVASSRVINRATRDFLRHDRTFLFIHLAAPDAVGHLEGWMSPAYLDVVDSVDDDLARLLWTLDRKGLDDSTVVLLTADHGGEGTRHSDALNPANFTVPFLAWGAQVPKGADLYALNSQLSEPGTARPGYQGPQPVRAASVANLATSLLQFGPVPGSLIDARQDFRITRS